MNYQNIWAIVFILLLISCGQKQKEVTPQTKQLTEAVYASGTLVPEEDYKVAAATDGYLTQINVEEGSQVQKAQLLFVVNNSAKEAGLAAALALADKTNALTGSSSPVLKALYDNLSTANLRLYNDSLQYVRYRNLYEQNAIAQSSFEKWQQQYLTTKKEKDALTEQIAAQRLSFHIQQQQAANSVRLSATEKANGVIRSAISGVVYEVYKKQGEHVMAYEPIALIGSGKSIARLSVDEDDFEKIRLGQKVVIKVDAFEDKVFQGHITKIYPVLNKAEQTFRIDVTLTKTPSHTLYGLNIEANIVTEEKRQVMAIPKEALLQGDSVLIKEKDLLSKVKITKGAEDRNWVEVKAGLSANHSIIVQ